MSEDLIERRIAALYGRESARALARARRGGHVLHVAAAWRAPDGGLRNILAGAHAPESRSDRFVLGLARAHADAVVTTGRVLRDELGLTLAPLLPDGAMLAEWRRRVLGRASPPIVVVLTSGADLDLRHPLFAHPGGSLVFTGEQAAARLASAGRDRGIEIVGHPRPDLGALVAYLVAVRGLGCIDIEAGPSTTRPVYCAPEQLEPALRVDELLLSICEAPRLPAAARGDRFVDEASIEAAGLRKVGEGVGFDAEGQGKTDAGRVRWRFRRYVRAPDPAPGK